MLKTGFPSYQSATTVYPDIDQPSPVVQLHEETYKRTIEVLARYNELTDNHRAVISALSFQLAQQVYGGIEGRYVVNLDAGLGKTTTLKCLIAAMHHLGLKQGLLITSAKIEPNEEIISDLIHHHDVEPEKLGAYHSGEGSISYDLCNSTQFLFICHARFNYSDRDTDKWLSDFYTFKGQQRALCIYDEAIETTKHIAVSFTELALLTSHIETQAKLAHLDSPQYHVLRELTQYLESLKSEHLASCDAIPVREGVSPNLVEVRGFTDEAQTIDVRRLLSDRYIFGSRYAVHADTLQRLIDLQGHTCQVLSCYPWSEDKYYKNTGMVASFVTVPKELTQICCLDASYTADKLSKLDTTITLSRYMNRPEFKNLKRFDQVTLYTANKASGKNVLDSEYSQSMGTESLRYEVINDYRKNQGRKALFTAHPRVTITTEDSEGKKSFKIETFEDLLKQDLEEAGLSTDISICTWGSHTTTNEHKHCDLVYLASNLNLPVFNVACNAQSKNASIGDPFYDYSKHSNVHELSVSRKCVDDYQAINRAIPREVESINGVTQAKRCDIKLADGQHIREIEDMLKELMPGLNIVEWELDSARDWMSEQEKLKRFILRELDVLAESGTTTITVDKFKKMHGFTKQSQAEKDMFSAAVSDVFASNASGWIRKTSRTWVIFSFDDYN